MQPLDKNPPTDLVRSWEVSKQVLWRSDGTVHTTIRYFDGTEEQWKTFKAELEKSSSQRHQQAMRGLRETNTIALQKFPHS
jgi:hypothetical protein